MLERILETYKHCSFDFRKFACKRDPLSHLFKEWVDYYRMKYSICKVVNPKTILEIGVRYGYSAIAFLKASSGVKYVGIDNDSDMYGEEKDAIYWAKRITKGHDTEFIFADSQDLDEFPGVCHDLIHIDGRQDGDGTFNDLEKSIRKGCYILVDGYFRTKENMLSSTYFLEKYKNFIEFAIIIPGYAGDLLIKVSDRAHILFETYKKKEYSSLRDAYDTEYFLKNCGGYDDFSMNMGVELTDQRLLSIFYLVDAKAEEKILDIGCGRGELALALARMGANVSAIDYSRSSIEIASSLLDKKVIDLGKLVYVHGDILEYGFDKRFDKVIASDVIEHIEHDSFMALLFKVKSLLADDGVFIIHTTPNKLKYIYEYRKAREAARKIGSYLPFNPRSFYEDLMHINEQTPASLNRALKKCFSSCFVWVPDEYGIAGTLAGKISKSKFRKADSIFAVASNADLDLKRIVSSLEQHKLSPRELDVKIHFKYTAPVKFHMNEKKQFALTIHNKGNERFTSLPPYPVLISYHWKDAKGNFQIFNGLRTPISLPLRPGEKREFNMWVEAPEKKGAYTLQVSLVQEQNFWFEDLLPYLPVDVPAIIE